MSSGLGITWRHLWTLGCTLPQLKLCMLDATKRQACAHVASRYLHVARGAETFQM